MRHRSEHLIVQLRPLGVNQENSLTAGENTDVAPEAFQHVYAVTQVPIFDGRLAPIRQVHRFGRPASCRQGQDTAACESQTPEPRSDKALHVSSVAVAQGATQPMTGTELMEFLGLPSITRSL